MTQQPSVSEHSAKTLSHLVSLVQDFETAMLVTRKRAGGLHGRPMSVAAIDDDGTLWFVTSVTSLKIDELSDDSRAMVSLQRPNQFICLNGNAELVFDHERVRSLWKEGYRVWFPAGAEPNVVLLRFTPYDGEYWDVTGLNGIKHAFECAKGSVERWPDTAPGSHR